MPDRRMPLKAIIWIICASTLFLFLSMSTVPAYSEYISVYMNPSRHSVGSQKVNKHDMIVTLFASKKAEREGHMKKTLSNEFQGMDSGRKNDRKVHAMNINKTTHVAFLKVHKASSTCMQNLFFRFALKHDLNILLPKTGNHIGYKIDQMPLKPSQHFDIFACHAVYNHTFFKSLLPIDSVSIGIVRDPVERMISAAYYYRDVGRHKYLLDIPKHKFVNDLVMHPERYDRSHFSKTRNSMGYDYGFSKYIEQNDNYQIRRYLDTLKSQFLLVLVVEKLNESLILMRRLLHWSISDILYLKSNVHRHEPVKINETERKKFRNTSFLDFEIYEYFTKVLNKMLQEVDEEFWKEVQFFRSVLERVTEFCSTAINRKDFLVIEQSPWDAGFRVSVTGCNWMKMYEGDGVFLDTLRSRHMKMNNISESWLD